MLPHDDLLQDPSRLRNRRHPKLLLGGELTIYEVLPLPPKYRGESQSLKTLHGLVHDIKTIVFSIGNNLCG